MSRSNPFISRLVGMCNAVLLFVFGRSGDYTRVWLDWQNLREDPKGTPRGFPWHGRAWLHLGSRVRVSWSWSLWARFCMASVSLDQEDAGLHFSVGLPPIAFWFGIDGVLSRPWMNRHFKYENREISLRVHDWALWWSVWRDDNGWDSSVPKWRSGNFRPLDVLLGKARYSTRDLSSQAVLIPMPEGAYPATVRLFESTWSRPRWFAKHLVRAEVTPAKPIPVPGEGESEWNCGEDAIHSLTTPASSVEEAVAAMVSSALGTRRRYGSAMMKYPQPGAAT